MRGVNIREVRRLLGHSSLDTTVVYTHVIRNLRNTPVSPRDTLDIEPMREGRMAGLKQS